LLPARWPAQDRLPPLAARQVRRRGACLHGAIMTALLEVRNLSKRFGGLQATKDVSFTLNEGEIVGLIGPNGAGKTTLVNLITGVLTASGGSVIFKGRDVTRQRPIEAARSGLARTF